MSLPDKCPLKDDCLEECTFEHIAYKVTADAIEQLIFLADEITEEEEERNKSEYDRRWEAEADYWNVRRCGPMMNRKGKTMIEIKADTTDHRTAVDVKVDADLIEYGAEILAIIHSLMGAVKNDDARLHAAILKALSDDPKILLGEDESDKARANLAEAMSKSILKKGVN